MLTPSYIIEKLIHLRENKVQEGWEAWEGQKIIETQEPALLAADQ